MEKNTFEREKMPEGFSGFTWAIAAFCMPVLLWPVSLLLSPNLLNNSTLTTAQSTWISVFFWVYPLILAVLARIWYRVHQTKPAIAKRGLALSAVLFYAVLYYICSVGFSA
ncbi:DUF5389 family protein [Pasteurellaceae bacterium LIM206]|nr:DUF5389 family protein [Pasteurellaceae bacterium LIM206]